LKERLRIVDAVFRRPDTGAHLRLVVSVVAAILLYGAVGLWLVLSEPPLSGWGAEIALRVHELLSHEQSVDLEPPKPPEPPPQQLPPPQQPPPEVARVRLPHQRVSSAPPPPAQAGRVVAQEPQPNAPVDLTGNTFVTGTGKAYAGGVTASSGTNTTPVYTRDVNPNATPHVQRTPDRSSTVALKNPDWTCPWPAEADAEQIDHQIAVVRVVVDVDGTALSATIINDPGHGFGKAALECARRERFIAARDRDGHSIRSESPPIRVRFTR
jgi:periplasmic protein TonB